VLKVLNRSVPCNTFTKKDFCMLRFLSLPIRMQLLLIVLIAALPAAGIILYTGLEQRNDAMKEARQETQKLAAIIASEHGYRVAAAEQLLKVMAQLPDVRKHKAGRVEPILRSLLKLHTDYSNIFIADLNGTVWASALPTQGVNVSDRRYFKNAAATGRLSSGEYLISRFTNKNVFTLAYPFLDDQSRLTGIIVLGFDLDYYKHLLGTADKGLKKGYLLLDHRGIVLTWPREPKRFVGKQHDAAQFKAMQQGPDDGTVVEKGIDGEERFISYRKLRLEGEQEPSLYVRASIPVAVVLAEATGHLMTNLGLLILFVLAALQLAWFVGKRSIVDRVAHLEAASHKMAGGDLQIRVAAQVKGGELGSLGLAFDHMALQLTEREQEKNKLIDDLQQAMATIKTLQGILPICSSCKKIRNNEGQWTQMESYICKHTEAEFSHGLCPDCAKDLYPKYYDRDAAK